MYLLLIIIILYSKHIINLAKIIEVNQYFCKLNSLISTFFWFTFIYLCIVIQLQVKYTYILLMFKKYIFMYNISMKLKVVIMVQSKTQARDSRSKKYIGSRLEKLADYLFLHRKIKLKPIGTPLVGINSQPNQCICIFDKHRNFRFDQVRRCTVKGILDTL